MTPFWHGFVHGGWIGLAVGLIANLPKCARVVYDAWRFRQSWRGDGR